MPLRAALCPRPAGMEVASEVAAAVEDAGRRLADAGWTVEEIADTPLFKGAAEVNERPPPRPQTARNHPQTTGWRSGRLGGFGGSNTVGRKVSR